MPRIHQPNSMENDFQNQLEAAIERGQQKGDREARSAKQQTLSSEEIRRRHNDFRLDLSEHIEQGLQQLANHFPGFKYETIYGTRGWGGALSRDDIDRGADGRTGAFFSRIEITVKPLNEFNLVNITGKGTIRDKELLTWNHFENIGQADQALFRKTIDRWMLEYAELFAAR